MKTQIPYYVWGKMHDNRDAITRWEGQVEEFKTPASYKEPPVIDGEPIELEWNILKGFSSLQLLQKIQNVLRERNIEPETIHISDHLHVNVQRHRLDKKRNRWKEFAFQIQKESRNTRREFLQRHWTFLGPGDETRSGKEENGTLLPLKMVARFEDTSHPVFTSIGAQSCGILRKKIDRDTVHFNADASNTEFLSLNHESAQYLRE